MARTIFDPSARGALLARIDRLEATPPARFGTFTAPRMVSHLIDSVRMALGDLSSADWGVLIHKHVDHHLAQFGA
jgi:hypothetical protein